MFSYFSLSNLSSFDDCKFRWYQHYIKKNRSVNNQVYFAFGNCIDYFCCQAVEKYNRGEFDIKDLTEETYFLWKEEIRSILPEDCEQEKIDSYRENLPKALKEAEDKIFPLVLGKAIATQRENIYPIYDSGIFGPLGFKGVLDILMPDNHIIDIKAPGKMWGKGDEKAKVPMNFT